MPLRECPDLIVCDVQLPDIEGFEVARWLKSHPELRAIPLVAVTALAMVGDRDRVLAAGFDGYLAKPIDPETFVRQIEGFLPLERRAAAPRPPAVDSRPALGAARNGRPFWWWTTCRSIWSWHGASSSPRATR